MANNVSTAIDALETALALITEGNSYNYTLGNKPPFTDPNPPENIQGDNPHVYIVDTSEELEFFATNRIFNKVTVTLMGITAGQMAATEEKKDRVLKLGADIENAVYADKTLGGAVTVIRKVSGETTFNRGSNHGIIEMDFELHLHYTEGSS